MLRKKECPIEGYFSSTVTATLAKFDYNYDIYKEAAEKFKKDSDQKAKEGKRPHFDFYILSLKEFLETLKFKEKELLRLITVWNSHEGNVWEEFRKANTWQWPEEWENVGWNCPIIRQDELSKYAVENELMHTRSAIERYRKRMWETTSY